MPRASYLGMKNVKTIGVALRTGGDLHSYPVRPKLRQVFAGQTAVCRIGRFNDVKGKTVRTAEFSRAKVVILNLWATVVRPLPGGRFPNFIALQKQYEKQGLGNRRPLGG